MYKKNATIQYPGTNRPQLMTANGFQEIANPAGTTSHFEVSHDRPQGVANFGGSRVWGNIAEK